MVARRLGHTSASFTLDTYAHELTGHATRPRNLGLILICWNSSTPDKAASFAKVTLRSELMVRPGVERLPIMIQPITRNIRMSGGERGCAPPVR